MSERERHLAQVDRQFVRGEITVAEYTAEYDKHPRDYIEMARDLVAARMQEQQMVERVWDALGKHYTPWYRRAWDAVVRLVRWR